MRKLAIGLMAVTLGLNIIPLDGTLSFLTSEKKQVSSVSTGTNEDVFVTETNTIVLKTNVAKRVKVKRTKNADGSSSETRESRISIQEGVQRISFSPQRAHLDLDVENMKVTGLDEGVITIEKVENVDEEQGIVFRIGHNRQMADFKNKTEKGELHVTALGGFYSLTIPITVRTSYSSSTDVNEEAAPGQPDSSQPPSTDTSEPPPSEDKSDQPPPSEETSEPLPPSSEETSEPLPPSSEETGTDPPSPDTPQEDSATTPNNEESQPADNPAPITNSIRK